MVQAWLPDGRPGCDRALLVDPRVERVPIDMGWSFTTRADLEAVVRIEFTPDVAEQVLASHEGTEVDYAVNLWWRAF